MCHPFRFYSPRDSTGGLGVKMVEYVLGGSPTNKESPLSTIESRLHGLKFDEKVRKKVHKFRFDSLIQFPLIT